MLYVSIFRFVQMKMHTNTRGDLSVKPQSAAEQLNWDTWCFVYKHTFAILSRKSSTLTHFLFTFSQLVLENVDTFHCKVRLCNPQVVSSLYSTLLITQPTAAVDSASCLSNQRVTTVWCHCLWFVWKLMTPMSYYNKALLPVYLPAHW